MLKKADLVFAGHDHVYMRTASLVDNKRVATNNVYLEKDGETYKAQVQPKGTTYLISGTAGVKTYQPTDVSKTDEYFPRAEKMLSLETPMYSDRSLPIPKRLWILLFPSSAHAIT